MADIDSVVETLVVSDQLTAERLAKLAAYDIDTLQRFLEWEGRRTTADQDDEVQRVAVEAIGFVIDAM